MLQIKRKCENTDHDIIRRVCGEFGKVARAKGTLWVDNEFLRFELADRMYIITGSPDDNCQCVVIGQGLDEKKINRRLSLERRMLRLR